MNQLEGGIGGAALAQDFLLEIFGALLGPMVIIGRDRRIIFRSLAFEDLLGAELREERLQCNVLILPRSEGCCVEAIDHYPDYVQTGIWNIRSARDGTLVPVLANWRPVNIGPSMSFLAIHFELLAGKPSPVAHSFFNGLRSGSPDTTSYWQRVRVYLENTFGVRSVALVERQGKKCSVEFSKGLSSDELAQVTEVLSETSNRNQDIMIGPPDAPEVLHAVSFKSGSCSCALVLGRFSDAFSMTLYDTAIAALNSAVHHRRAIPADLVRDIDSQALIETLSPAESEVLAGLVAGLTDKEIAMQRKVSPYTVKNQVKAILRKTGAMRRTELIRRMQVHRGGHDHAGVMLDISRESI